MCLAGVTWNGWFTKIYLVIPYAVEERLGIKSGNKEPDEAGGSGIANSASR